MAKFLICLYGPTRPDPDRDSSNDLAEHQAYAEQIQQEDVLRSAFVVSDPTATVTLGNVHDDASAAEPRGALVGAYVIEIDDLDEALAVAQRNPITSQGGYLEVRQIED